MACGLALFDDANPRCFSPPFHVRRASPPFCSTAHRKITLNHHARASVRTLGQLPSSGAMRAVYGRWRGGRISFLGRLVAQGILRRGVWDKAHGRENGVSRQPAPAFRCGGEPPRERRHHLQFALGVGRSSTFHYACEASEDAVSDIFISYKREDRNVASEINDLCKNTGLTTFYDTQVPVGDMWDLLIERELRAARSVLVLWSPRSIGSRWVRLEARHGLSRGILCPLVVEDCEIPLEFADIQAASWAELRANEARLAAFIQRIREIAKSEVPNETILPIAPILPNLVQNCETPLIRQTRAALAQCDYAISIATQSTSSDTLREFDAVLSKLKQAIGALEGCDTEEYEADEIMEAREAVWDAAKLFHDRQSYEGMRQAKFNLDQAAYVLSKLLSFEIGLLAASGEET